MGFRCINRGHLAAFLGLILWASNAFTLPAVIDLPEQNPSNEQLEIVKQLNAEFSKLTGEIYFGSRNLNTWRFKTENLSPFERQAAAEKTKVLGWDQCRNTTVKLFEYPLVKYEKNFVGMEHRLAVLIARNGFAQMRIEAGVVVGWQKGAWVKLSPDCSNILLGVDDRGLELIRLSAATSEAAKVSKLPYKFSGPNYYFFADNRTLAHFDYKKLELLRLDSNEVKEVDQVADETSLKMIPSKPEELCWSKYRTFKIGGNIEVRCINRLTGKIGEPAIFKDPRSSEGQLRLVRVDSQKIAADVGGKETRAGFIVTAGSDTPLALPESGILRLSDSRLLFLKKQGLNEDAIEGYDVRSRQLTGNAWEAQPNGWFQFAQEEPDHTLVTATNSYGQTVFYSFSQNEGVQFRFRHPEYQAPVKVQSIDIADAQGSARPALLLTGGRKYDLAKNVIVFVHGGGCHLNLDINQRQIVLKEMLSMAERGYPVLAITYRNDKLPPPYKSDNSPRTAENCGTEEMNDIVSGYYAAKRLYPTANVFLWGMSHGGYLVNVLATQDTRAKLFKGIISQAGIWAHNLGHNFIDSAKDHYSPARAPILFVDKINVPFFMYHGTNDRNASYPIHAQEFLKLSGVVPVSGNEHLFRFYKHPSKSISALIVEGDDHHFDESKSFDLFVDALENFVKQNQ